jgi:UDP-galactopyranose mutase
MLSGAMKVDWVVVGAGFTGATFAERMASAGRRVVIFDQRPHVGGNAYDEVNEHGILVHRYGPHIFHTNSAVVWSYLSQFTVWRSYEHRVLGRLNERLIPIPFNFNSLDAVFEPNEASRLQQQLLVEYGPGKGIPILKLRGSKSSQIRHLADYVYKNVYENYTIKQWGLSPEELDPSVTGRVRVLIGRDDRYFQDKFQAVPLDGYAAMLQRMLQHKNISIRLDCEWTDATSAVSPERIFYTGPIDRLMDYCFSPLPYRSIRFKEETLNKERHQPVATINYPGPEDYTRTTELKLLTGQKASVTTLVAEYPMPYQPNRTNPDYPIPQEKNRVLYGRYLAAAQKAFPNMTFAGRLADYQYYNMDQACARALKLASDHGAAAPGPPAPPTPLSLADEFVE